MLSVGINKQPTNENPNITIIQPFFVDQQPTTNRVLSVFRFTVISECWTWKHLEPRTVPVSAFKTVFSSDDMYIAAECQGMMESMALISKPNPFVKNNPKIQRIITAHTTAPQTFSEYFKGVWWCMSLRLLPPRLDHRSFLSFLAIAALPATLARATPQVLWPAMAQSAQAELGLSENGWK